MLGEMVAFEHSRPSQGDGMCSVSPDVSHHHDTIPVAGWGSADANAGSRGTSAPWQSGELKLLGFWASSWPAGLSAASKSPKDPTSASEHGAPWAAVRGGASELSRQQREA